jgi:hypothetical protein
MKSDLRELWLSVVGAFIRFWDNRFSAKECFSCKILETELARKREENSNLVDRLLGLAIQPAEPDVADSKLEAKLEAIHRAQVPWMTKKRELEMAHSRNKPVNQGNDLETFEENLAELSK